MDESVYSQVPWGLVKIVLETHINAIYAIDEHCVYCIGDFIAIVNHELSLYHIPFRYCRLDDTDSGIVTVEHVAKLKEDTPDGWDKWRPGKYA